MAQPTSKISFGNVSFRSEQIQEKKDYQAENGKQRYSVSFKNGQKIDFPEQTKKGAFVEADTYNGSEEMIVKNIDNSTIYGNPNKSDKIGLFGTSSNNSVILDNDKKELFGNATAIGSGLLPGVGTVIGSTIDAIKQLGNKQNDKFFTGCDTKDNTIKMGEKDSGTTYLNYSCSDYVNVEGKGICDQETQIKGLY